MAGQCPSELERQNELRIRRFAIVDDLIRSGGAAPCGTGLSAPLKPRLCRVFTLRASIPAAVLAEALGEFVAVGARCDSGAGE